jgi:hypothetical protein
MAETTENVTIIDLSKPEGQRVLVRPLQPDELAQRERDRTADVQTRRSFRRAERNALLQQTDFTQLMDAPRALRDLYAPYRQALRDHPLDDTPFPDPPV